MTVTVKIQITVHSKE